MLPSGMPGIGDIPNIGIILLGRTLIGADISKVVIMTGGSMNSTIVARGPAGIKDTVPAARQATPADLNRVRAMWVPRLGLSQVQAMWVRVGLNRGPAMWARRLVLNLVPVMWVRAGLNLVQVT